MNWCVYSNIISYFFLLSAPIKCSTSTGTSTIASNHISYVTSCLLEWSKFWYTISNIELFINNKETSCAETTGPYESSSYWRTSSKSRIINRKYETKTSSTNYSIGWEWKRNWTNNTNLFPSTKNNNDRIALFSSEIDTCRHRTNNEHIANELFSFRNRSSWHRRSSIIASHRRAACCKIIEKIDINRWYHENHHRSQRTHASNSRIAY